MMSKRDKLPLFLRKVSKPSNTASRHASPVPAHSAPSVSTPIAQSATSTSNPALSLAIQRHLDGLSEADKAAFREAAKQITNANLLSRIKSHNDEHAGASRIRPYAENVSRFLGVLDRFMGGIAIAVQANPDVSSIIVGAVRGAIDVVIQYATFFAKFSEMLSRMHEYLAPLASYCETSAQSATILECLSNVYGDLLQFSSHARRVFIDQAGRKRTFTSWRLFWRLQWVPFEEEFGKIELSMKHHLDVLGHGARGEILGATKQAIRDGRDISHRMGVLEREKFLNWLSSLPSEKTHDGIYAKKHPHTGDWLLQSPQFQDWFGCRGSATLWCYGKRKSRPSSQVYYWRYEAGAGKSVLASNVVEYITRNRALRKDVGICFVYYDYKNKELGDISQVILALMKQLCRGIDVIPAAFIKTQNDAVHPSHLGNGETFTLLAENFTETFVVIDALDECPQVERDKALSFLTKVTQSLPHAKVFVTSRRESDIKEEFTARSVPIIQVEAKSVATDILSYVQDEVKDLRIGRHGRKLHLQSETLEAKIVSTLSNEAEGMFLWVHLQLMHLCSISLCRKDKVIEEALRSLPRGLDETYDRILKQIASQTEYMRNLALQTFQWILYAERPLTMKELQCAIAAGTPSGADSAPDKPLDLDDPATILDACGNILAEEAFRTGSASVVRFMHYSVQEFLTSTLSNIPRSLTTDLKDLNKIQSGLARACIAYLSYSVAEDLRCELPGNLKVLIYSAPFTWYAAKHFDHHLSRCDHLSDVMIKRIIAFVNKPSTFLSTLLQLRSVEPLAGRAHEPRTWDDFRPYIETVSASYIISASKLYDMEVILSRFGTPQPPPNALYEASIAGLTVLAKRLLEGGANPDDKSASGTPAIYEASKRGFLTFVELLVSKGANVNEQGGRHGNALTAASSEGYQEIVELLLSNGAKVNAQGGQYGTALHAASLEGHEAIVKLLLNYTAEVNAQDKRYGTALQAASNKGHETIVEILLSRGADINTQGGQYGTALQAASSRGYKTIVEMLLSWGADVNTQCGFFGTALQAASYRGHETIVEMLLGWGADVNTQCGFFGTALQAASLYGHETIFELLRSKGAVS